MLQDVSSEDLTEWEAYSIVEPFGPRSDYHRTGLLVAKLHNVNRTKESQPAAKPEDFYPGRQPWEEEEAEEESPEIVAARVRAVFASLKNHQ